jgi:hypothetical protein
MQGSAKLMERIALVMTLLSTSGMFVVQADHARWQDECNDFSKVNSQTLHVFSVQGGFQHSEQL